MTLMKKGEQLKEIPFFPGIELGAVVREIDLIESAKSEANEEWNIQLKALKKRMFRLAASMKEVE